VDPAMEVLIACVTLISDGSDRDGRFLYQATWLGAMCPLQDGHGWNRDGHRLCYAQGHGDSRAWTPQTSACPRAGN
jgi:hypothetical protein